MAIQDGYSRYTCDVQGCANSTYALPDSDGADGYSTRRRIDAQGVERSLVLCADHAKVYQSIVEAVDAVFAQFERDGSNSMRTAADVAAVQAELDKAKADLASVTKDRDGWWRKAKDAEAERDAIKAEYDAYRAAHPETTETTEGGES